MSLPYAIWCVRLALHARAGNVIGFLSAPVGVSALMVGVLVVLALIIAVVLLVVVVCTVVWFLHELFTGHYAFG